MYKLDRNSFKASTVEEASNHSTYYKKMTWQERLKIVIYLNSIAFKLVGQLEPRMDKTVFSVKSRS